MLIRAALIAGAILCSTPANAWDGAGAGVIRKLELSSEGTNYGFRVHMVAGQPLCGAGTADWAAINSSASNYQAIVAALTSAYLTGKSVLIYVNKDANGVCVIGHMVV
jgi:hypothetical protein